MPTPHPCSAHQSIRPHVFHAHDPVNPPGLAPRITSRYSSSITGRHRGSTTTTSSDPSCSLPSSQLPLRSATKPRTLHETGWDGYIGVVAILASRNLSGAGLHPIKTFLDPRPRSCAAVSSRWLQPPLLTTAEGKRQSLVFTGAANSRLETLETAWLGHRMHHVAIHR